MARKKRILILGGGFGGIYTYLGLHNQFHGSEEVEITLVSETDYFFFVVLIHEVATGNLLPSSIVQPIRTLPRCCLDRFIEGKVTSLDLDKKCVVFQRGNKSKELSYDYLILALGSDTNFFGTPGAQQHCLTLKNIQDAILIKNRMIENFEMAEDVSSKEQEKLLRFVVVGGGPTGVELAGEMADFINDELENAFPHLTKFCHVLLIQSGTTLVPQVEAWFGEKAHDILHNKMNVSIIYNKRVTKVTPDGVYLGEEFLSSGTVIWTAGVKARKVKIQGTKPIAYEERTERIKVNEYLQIPSHPQVFVVGDQAWICDKEVGQPYPMRAQFATREGTVAAENVARLIRGEKHLREFQWSDAGFILSLGKGGALAKLFGIHFTGPFAWWLYRTAYFLKIVGPRAKLRTALEWTLNLFFPRDISKL